MKQTNKRHLLEQEQKSLSSIIQGFLDDTGCLDDIDQAADLVYGLEKLGRRLYRDEDKNQATRHFAQAVENLQGVITKGQHHSLEISLCESSAQTYLIFGAWDKARSNYEQAITLAQASGDHKSHARLLRRLANLESWQNRDEWALELLKESLELSTDHGELRDQAAALNSLAVVYFQSSDWQKMRRACNRALIIAEELKDAKLIGSIYNNLGAMHSVRGEWDQAFAAFQKSLPQFELIGNDQGLAETYNNMGTLYRDKEDWAKAGECYAKSLALAKESGNAFLKASTMLNRIELYVLMHDLELAATNCKLALQAFHDLENEHGVADACRLFGVIYTKKHNFKLAEHYFSEAFEIFGRYQNSLGLAETHNAYAELMLARNDTASALDHSTQAIESYQTIKASVQVRELKRKLKKLKVKPQ